MDPDSFTTTASQEFQLDQIRRNAHLMSREQLTDLLLQAARLAAIRQNVITALINQKGPCDGRH